MSPLTEQAIEGLTPNQREIYENRQIEDVMAGAIVNKYTKTNTEIAVIAVDVLAVCKKAHPTSNWYNCTTKQAIAIARDIQQSRTEYEEPYDFIENHLGPDTG